MDDSLNAALDRGLLCIIDVYIHPELAGYHTTYNMKQARCERYRWETGWKWIGQVLVGSVCVQEYYILNLD